MNPESFSSENIDFALSLSTPRCFFAKIDLKSAYRGVPINPFHSQLRGFRWSLVFGVKEFFVDNYLCFGLACAPAIFNKISCAIARHLRTLGFEIVVYLDDFLIIASDPVVCRAGQQTLLKILQDLGFEINWKKVIQPAQKIDFLGYVLDSVAEEVLLPYEKMAHLSTMAASLSKKNKVSKPPSGDFGPHVLCRMGNLRNPQFY